MPQKKVSIIGEPLPRIDSPEKTTGSATYSIDEALHGMLYGKILTSPYPHARIKSIDISKAKNLPGVKAILTHQDVLPTLAGKGAGIRVLDKEVRYVGDEVLAVAADTEEIADAALKLIDVDYEILPAVFDPEEALTPNAPKVHTEGNRISTIIFVGNLFEALPPIPGVPLEYAEGNLIPGEPQIVEVGNIEKGFLESDRIYEDVFTVFPQAVAPLGRLCAVARWEGDNLIVIDSTQTPFMRQQELAEWFQMPLNKIRVIHKYMGTGMGEVNTYRYLGIAAYLARKTGRPVKLITDTAYAFIGNQKKRANVKFYLKVGVKNNGTVMAIHSKAIWDKGAYGVGGPLACTVANLELYDAPNLKDECYPVYTNTPPNGAYRGYGKPEAYWPLEVLTDRIANDLGINPLDFRLKHMSSKRSKKTLEIAAEKAGWVNKWSLPSSKTGSKRRGIGIATVIGWSSGYAYMPWSAATVQLLLDGTVCVSIGIGDTGTGGKTVLAQVAADVLGLSMDEVKIITGDTTLPYDEGSYSSRVALCGGTAVYLAAENLKLKLFNAVAPVLEVNPGDLDVGGSRIFVKTAPDISMMFAEAAGMLKFTEVELVGYGTSPTAGPYEDMNPFSALVAEVEVDTETGEVELLGMTNCQDVGRCLNRGIVDAQLTGAICAGIGYALKEDVISDPSTGVILNSDFLQYKLPTILDVPALDVNPYEDEPNPCTPLGQRGCGEPPCVTPAPAINNAILNAIGVSINGTPITPDKILKALSKI